MSATLRNGFHAEKQRAHQSGHVRHGPKSAELGAGIPPPDHQSFYVVDGEGRCAGAVCSTRKAVRRVLGCCPRLRVKHRRTERYWRAQIRV